MFKRIFFFSFLSSDADIPLSLAFLAANLPVSAYKGDLIPFGYFPLIQHPLYF